MSTVPNAIQDILRTAIQREIDAYTVYSAAAKMVEVAHAKDMLNDLAAQEQGHRNRLEALLSGNVFRVISKTQQKKVVDLKITDYLIAEPLAADSDFQTILIVAGKREKASHDLYAALAKVSEDSETIKLFEFLANEELSHKKRIEDAYEHLVYRDN
jgi:rubrerythrin